jgi:hypothetical protein
MVVDGSTNAEGMPDRSGKPTPEPAAGGRREDLQRIAGTDAWSSTLAESP